MLLIFFWFFTNNVFAQEKSILLFDNIENAKNYKDYNWENKEVKFSKWTKLFDESLKYFFTYDWFDYAVKSNWDILNLSNWTLKKLGLPFFYEKEFYLENKDFVIYVWSDERAISTNKNAWTIVIYNKKIKDFFILDLSPKIEIKWLDLWNSFDNIFLNSEKSNFTWFWKVWLVWNLLYFYNQNWSKYLYYWLDLKNIPDEYFNWFFSYVPYLNYNYKSPPLLKNKLLDEKLKLSSFFILDFWEFMKTQNLYDPVFYKFDFKNINQPLSKEGLKWKDWKKLIYAWYSDINNKNLNFFLDFKNDWYWIIKNNYILYNNNWKVWYFYKTNNWLVQKNFWWFLWNLLNNYTWLKVTYLPQTRDYSISFLWSTIFWNFFSKTILINEKNLTYWDESNYKYYDWIYLAWRLDNWKYVFVSDDLLRVNNNNHNPNYWIINHTWWAYLYKNVSNKGLIVSDEPLTTWFNIFSDLNWWFFTDKKTWKDNDIVWDIWEDWWYITQQEEKQKQQEEKEEKERFEKLKKSKEEQEKKLEEWKKEFLERFWFLETIWLLVKVLNFEINVNSYKNFNIPVLKPVIENWKLKVDYEKVNTNLKPIDDNLNIAKNTINSDNQIWKDFLTVIFVVLYVFFRILVIWLIFIFSIFVYKIINNIVDYILPWISNDWTSWNVFSFLAYMSFLIVFSVLVYSLFSLSDNFLLFFNNIINFLDSIFVFFLESFFNLYLFLKILQTFNLWLYWCIVLFVIYKLALKFWRIL